MSKDNPPQITELYSSRIGNSSARVWYCQTRESKGYQITVGRDLASNDSSRSTQSFDPKDLEDLVHAVNNCSEWIRNNPLK